MNSRQEGQGQPAAAGLQERTILGRDLAGQGHQSGRLAYLEYLIVIVDFQSTLCARSRGVFSSYSEIRKIYNKVGGTYVKNIHSPRLVDSLRRLKQKVFKEAQLQKELEERRKMARSTTREENIIAELVQEHWRLRATR